MRNASIDYQIEITPSDNFDIDIFSSTLKRANGCQDVVQGSEEKAMIENGFEISVCINTLDLSRHLQSTTSEML